MMAVQFYKLEILTPTHIGDGRRYNRYDAVWLGGTLYVLDVGRAAALLQTAGIDPLMLADYMGDPGFSWGRLLRETRVEPSALADYAVPCATDPAAGGDDRREGEVFAFIRDANNRPYIPGSSIKGAIRSALVWRLLQVQPAGEIARKVGQGRKEFAAGQIERDLLGGDPNHDLLRALQVGDSEPIDPRQVAAIEVGRVQQNGEPSGITTHVEALRPGTSVRLKVKVDDLLLEQLSGELGWNAAQVALLRDGLAECCRDFSRIVLEKQQKFYRMNLPEAAGGFAVALGWGAGWTSKAPVGLMLRDEQPDFFEQTANNLGMGKRGVKIYADSFPTSHWMEMGGARQPLGWAVLTPTDQAPAITILHPAEQRELASAAPITLPRIIQQPPPRAQQREQQPSGPTFVPAESVRQTRTISGSDLRYDWSVSGEITEVKNNFIRVKIKSATNLQGHEMQVSDEPIGIMHRNRFADPADFKAENYSVGSLITAVFREVEQGKIQLMPSEGAAW